MVELLTDYTTQIYHALSTDTRPDADPGAQLREIDTGKRLIFDGNAWNELPDGGGGGSGGMVLLASGTYTLASDPSSTITIPVSYSGTPHFAVIMLNTEITGVGHAIASARYFVNPLSEMDALYPNEIFSVRAISSAGVYAYSSNADMYRLTISDTALSSAKPGNSYPWKAGTYSWYIYGEASE